MQGADADPGFSVSGIGVARAGRSRHESPCEPHPKRPESGADRPRRARIPAGPRSARQWFRRPLLWPLRWPAREKTRKNQKNTLTLWQRQCMIGNGRGGQSQTAKGNANAMSKPAGPVGQDTGGRR